MPPIKDDIIKKFEKGQGLWAFLSKCPTYLALEIEADRLGVTLNSALAPNYGGTDFQTNSCAVSDHSLNSEAMPHGFIWTMSTICMELANGVRNDRFRQLHINRNPMGAQQYAYQKCLIEAEGQKVCAQICTELMQCMPVGTPAATIDIYKRLCYFPALNADVHELAQSTMRGGHAAEYTNQFNGGN